MTLEFAGPKLTLPGESGGELLRLDTSEFRVGQPDAAFELEDELVDADRLGGPPDPALELDLEGMEPEVPLGAEPDGWTRLRESEAPPEPRRPRSVTPPPRRDAELDLVAKRSRPPSAPGIDLASEMEDRYALGDFTGALRVAELLLGRSPNDARAQKCAESSRERLLQLYSARLAALSSGAADTIAGRVPQVKVPEHEIRWLGLDHRQGFLLSRLDGESSIEDLEDLSGMTRLEVLKTLVELIEAGAISLA